MVQRGHQVRVIDFEIGWRKNASPGVIAPRKVLKSLPKVIEGSNITVVRPAAVRTPILEYASLVVSHGLEIRRQIEEFRPDVILGFGLLNAFAGIRQARRAKIPFVYYLIDELHRLVPQAAFRGLARILEQSNVRRASLVLSINQALRDYSVAMGAVPEKAKVLPAGVDLERYLSVGNGSEIRKRHDIQSEDFVLFFMGWVYPFSGLLEVVAALLAGSGSRNNAKLLVGGDFHSGAVAIGACEQNTGTTADGANNDPALRATIIRQRRNVLHELELQDLHKEIDRWFVLPYNQGNQFEMRHSGPSAKGGCKQRTKALLIMRCMS